MWCFVGRFSVFVGGGMVVDVSLFFWVRLCSVGEGVLVGFCDFGKGFDFFSG